MGKGLPYSHTRGDFAGGSGQSEVIRMAALPITIDGATGVGWGTVPIGDFPAGDIVFLGAVCYMQVVGAGAQAGLVDTWVGDYGVGTTPADDGTITAGDVDLIPSTALAAATAEVSPRTRGTQADGALAGTVFDNGSGALEINANVLVDDASISADGILATLVGELYISYRVLRRA